jgi:uncharacterized protein with HEPN domain
MPSDARDPAYLWDMRESARDAVRILGRLDLAGFLRPDQETVRLAVERKLEILGEAARRVSDALRQAHPEVPWKDIIGLRNVISHQYDKVNYAEVFRIVRDRLPGLIRTLDPLVPPLPPEGD